MKLMKDKNGKIFSREIFNLLKDKTLSLIELSLQNDELIIFQKNLLLVSKSKEEINYLIKLSDGLEKGFQFIEENCAIICNVLETNFKIFASDNTNYLLALPKLIDKDDIDNIYISLQNIFYKTRDKKYKNIDLKELFEQLIYFYSNKTLNDFCKLHNIIIILKTQKINAKIIENFYEKVHSKGMSLIKEKKMDINEIIRFIVEKDIYYYNPIFKHNNKREPKIFQYIPITDIDNNYLYYISLIKKYKLWSIFSESNITLRKEFYEILLNQMKKLEDIESIFMIFPIKVIDIDFTLLLNQKIEEIKYSILDKKSDTYDLCFSIFDRWLICNENNNLDLNYIAKSLMINYEIPSKYFFYLIKKQDMNFIV